jgi:type I restriction enzyme S subunit
MKYGLSEKQLNEIAAFISPYSEIEEAVLFGSRAMDTYKEASDVDIALKGDRVTASLAAKLKFEIEEDTYLPFFFDFVAYPTITNEALKEHIDTKGIVIYRKGWRECRLGEVAEVQTGPFGSQLHSSDYVSIGIPSIMPTNIGNRLEIRRDNIACIKDSDAKRLERYLVEEEDIVYSRRGDVEKCAYITNDESGWLCGTGCLRIRFNRQKIIPKYCAYYLSTDEIKSWISGHAVGTTMPNLNSTILLNVPIILPSLHEQQTIASVLSSLDDKIDLLHRQNKTLEAMAETLFRQWFVEEADEGWEEKPLNSIANFLNGLACQKYSPTNECEKLPVLKIKELSSGISETSDWATFEVDPEYIIQTGDVIFAWSASLMVKVWDGEKCVLNQHLFKVTSDRFPKWYYLEWCKYHLAEFISISLSHATTMGHIKRSDLDSAMVLVPSNRELSIMSEQMNPLLEKQIRNFKQIYTIEKLRDTLLPKLMSGEVRVGLEEIV